jgi:hypothetical protein
MTLLLQHVGSSQEATAANHRQFFPTKYRGKRRNGLRDHYPNRTKPTPIACKQKAADQTAIRLSTGPAATGQRRIVNRGTARSPSVIADAPQVLGYQLEHVRHKRLLFVSRH